MEFFKWWWNEIPKEGLLRSQETLEQGGMTSGAVVEEFEAELRESLNVPSIVVVNSGTSALATALMVKGIGPGSRVCVPSLTWIATAQAAHNLGAEVIIVDVDYDTMTLSPERLEEEIRNGVDAVIHVHFNGRSGRIQEIRKICADHNILLIEDRCKALGTTFMEGGVHSKTSLYALSFGMISHISVGYGGALVCGDPEIAWRIRLARDHGMIRDPERYYSVGSNFKMADFVAALGIPQVSRLGERVSCQISYEDRYRRELDGIRGVRVMGVHGPTHQLDVGTYVEVLAETHESARNLQSQLMKVGVEVKQYHKSLSEVSYLKAKPTPVADEISSRLFAVPSGSYMNPQLASEVSRRTRKIFESTDSMES